MRTPRRLALLLALLALLGAESCIVVDAPLLGLRTVAGGIHNRRRGVGIVPFFFPDGRLGCMANGALFVEDETSELRMIVPQHYEVDDPAASLDCEHVICVAGKDQVTAGGAQNDHVFQIYTVRADGSEWTRLTRSRLAEVHPRYLPSGEIVFVRRPEHRGWALYEPPWSDGAVFLARADGSDERRLTEPLFHPFRGLAPVEEGGAIVFGASSGEGEYDVWRLALVEGAQPELLVPDATLPAPLPGGEGLVHARGRRGEETLGRTAYASFDVCVSTGEQERVLCAGRGEILGLAVSPDGARVVFSELDPEEGQFGTYLLLEVPVGGGEPRLLQTAPYRSENRFKPGDLVQPVSWWGRTRKYAPGSR